MSDFIHNSVTKLPRGFGIDLNIEAAPSAPKYSGVERKKSPFSMRIKRQNLEHSPGDHPPLAQKGGVPNNVVAT